MAYTPRTFDQITQDAIDYAVGQRTAVSDFNKGAVIRTLIEAFTLEQARLYLGLAQGINEAQENAAYQTFGFTRLPAAYAYGQVLFVRDPGAALDATTVIPKGTQLSSSSTGVTYVTSTDVTLDATTSQQLVVATATTPGAIGNANAGQITIVTGGAASFFSLGQVTNPRAFITGADLETDAQRRVRFAQFLQGLHRATKEAILFGVQQTVLFDSAGYIVEQVLKAQTIEEAPGLVWVWVHNGVGNTSNDLVQQADNVLSGYIDATGVVHTGWKAAGIRTQVFAATETAVPVEAVIEIETGRLAEVVALQVEDAVARYLQTLNVGDICRVESIKQAIRRTPGVLDIIAVTSPLVNIVPGDGQMITASSITVSVAS